MHFMENEERELSLAPSSVGLTQGMVKFVDVLPSARRRF